MKTMSEKEYIEREVLIKQFETLKEKAETLRYRHYTYRQCAGGQARKMD